jgi:hypothetical protein
MLYFLNVCSFEEIILHIILFSACLGGTVSATGGEYESGTIIKIIFFLLALSRIAFGRCSIFF